MATIQREADRKTVAKASRTYQASDSAISARRKHFGQMETSDVKRLKSFER